MSENIIGKYTLQKHLGNGAYGDVYLAYDNALHAIKAIKVIDAPNPYEVKKKLEEAQILHKCKHKNIVHVNEANVYEVNLKPLVVIDMEYLPLGSFEDAILNNSISIHTTVRYIIDCLFALEHAHITGILHRDVKPANIMLCEYGAKLSDFGLATVLGSAYAGSSKGYLTHLPPEFYINGKTTELTDIFAVGITLFRACNYISDWRTIIGNFPNPTQVIESGKLVSVIGYAPFIPLKLKKIINKSCSPVFKSRYQLASEFRQALERLKPKIDWIPSNNNSFSGTCCRSGANFSIEITSNTTAFQVTIKKNNRRQNNLCRIFNDINDANNYFYSHISSTLFY